MTDNIAKITKVVLWVLVALSMFYALMLFTNSSKEDITWINNSLRFTEILLILTAGISVLFALYLFVMVLIKKPKKALVKLIPFVLLGIILLVGYSLASDIPLEMPNYQGEDNTPIQNKWMGVSIYMIYITLGMAVLAIIGTSIARLFK